MDSNRPFKHNHNNSRILSQLPFQTNISKDDPSNFTTKFNAAIMSRPLDKITIPSNSDYSSHRSSSSEDKNLYILKVKDKQNQNNKCKIKVYNDLDLLKKKIGELTDTENNHYAETECYSPQQVKSILEMSNDCNSIHESRSEARQPSDNSLLSSWMLDSDSNESLDLDEWDMDKNEVIQKARNSLKYTYNCKVWD